MVMAVCDFILAALWMVNLIIGCVNVANGQPFANNISIACAYLLDGSGLYQPWIGSSKGAII